MGSLQIDGSSSLCVLRYIQVQQKLLSKKDLDNLCYGANLRVEISEQVVGVIGLLGGSE